MSKRIKTNYPGVFYREARRIGGRGTERVYYIVFKKNGKVHEEKVGRQYADAMTSAQAAHMRSGRIEGKRLSPKGLREARERQRWAEANKWTIRPSLGSLQKATRRLRDSTDRQEQLQTFKAQIW